MLNGENSSEKTEITERAGKDREKSKFIAFMNQFRGEGDSVVEARKKAQEAIGKMKEKGMAAGAAVLDHSQPRYELVPVSKIESVPVREIEIDLAILEGVREHFHGKLVAMVPADRAYEIGKKAVNILKGLKLTGRKDYLGNNMNNVGAIMATMFMDQELKMANWIDFNIESNEGFKDMTDKEIRLAENQRRSKKSK